MPFKVYCEDCEFLTRVPTICGVTGDGTTKLECSHEDNVKHKDTWLRKNPKQKVFSCSPMIKNTNNDCRGFKTKINRCTLTK